MKRNGSYIREGRTTTSKTSVSGVYDLYDVYHARRDDKWPIIGKFISLTPSTTTVAEGSSMTFSLTFDEVEANTPLYYTIATVSGTTMTDADISSAPNSQTTINGTFNAAGNGTQMTMTLTFGFVAEQSPGDAESNVFKLQIRTESVSGPIAIEAVDITLTDAIALGDDIRSSFYEISHGLIVDTTSSDYTGAYNVGEVQQDYGGSASIYIALKCTTSTTYYNDICVAAVQVLNSSNVVQQTWHFTNSSTSWTTSVRSSANSSLLSSYLTPSQAASNSQYSITTSANNTRVSLASSTSSSYTGMAGGISSSVTNFPVGNGTVSQTGSAYYLYGEVSGATRYTHVIMKGPSYTFTAGDKIKVVHACVVPSSMQSSFNFNDSVWIGIW